MTELASLCVAAKPTAFHAFLKKLDQQDRLLRCYTQNIDGLEARSGLSIGIPRCRKQRKGKRQSDESWAKRSTWDDAQLDDSGAEHIPRCIPLHGQLTHLLCPICSASFPIGPFLPLPPFPIPCPTCQITSTIRRALSERARRVGHLRASIVLYGEEHPQGESIGSVVESDLRGTKEDKIDLLLVVGTGLTVPGVKRIVREMARKLHTGQSEGIKVIYINETPADRMREWEQVFDVWIQGDIQEFIINHFSAPTIPVTPSKRKDQPKTSLLPTPVSTPKRRRKVAKNQQCSSDWTTATLNRDTSFYPTPRQTPISVSFKIMEDTSTGSLSPLSSLTSDDEDPFLKLGERTGRSHVV